MHRAPTRRVRRIAALAVLPIAALALSACGPTPAPGPAAVYCTSGSGGTAYSYAVEKCHLNYSSYKLDTANNYAQQRAGEIAAFITPTQCANGSLGNYHVQMSWLQFVYGGYGGAGVQVGENLYCSYSSNLQCPTNAADAATKAMNAWIKSAGHKANLDKFRGKSVNGGGACQVGRGVYVALAHFHNP